jgi:histidinol-phosphate aminotransferase
LAAATAALSDQAFIRFSAAGNVTGREQITDGLHALGLETMPSYGNFVTVRTGRAMELAHELEARGVITRPLDAYGLHDWLRITIGLHHHNSRLLSELSDMLTHPENRHAGLQESSISEL